MQHGNVSINAIQMRHATRFKMQEKGTVTEFISFKSLTEIDCVDQSNSTV